MTYGSKTRARARGAARGQGNLGRYSRPAINKRKMSGKKTSKNVDFRYTCVSCNKTSMQKTGYRAKKVEYV